MKSIFVANLSCDTHEGDLRTLFELFGEVAGVSVVNDGETREPRCFAFVEMEDNEQASEAINNLNGREVAGCKLRVNEAALQSG